MENLADVLGLAGGQGAGHLVFQQAGEAHDEVQGRAQLVADDRDELVLVAIGLLQLGDLLGLQALRFRGQANTLGGVEAQAEPAGGLAGAIAHGHHHGVVEPGPAVGLPAGKPERAPGLAGRLHLLKDRQQLIEVLREDLLDRAVDDLVDLTPELGGVRPVDHADDQVLVAVPDGAGQVVEDAVEERARALDFVVGLEQLLRLEQQLLGLGGEFLVGGLKLLGAFLHLRLDLLRVAAQLVVERVQLLLLASELFGLGAQLLVGGLKLLGELVGGLASRVGLHRALNGLDTQAVENHERRVLRLDVVVLELEHHGQQPVGIPREMGQVLEDRLFLGGIDQHQIGGLDRVARDAGQAVLGPGLEGLLVGRERAPCRQVGQEHRHAFDAHALHVGFRHVGEQPQERRAEGMVQPEVLRSQCLEVVFLQVGGKLRHHRGLLVEVHHQGSRLVAM
ncbi:hypothetical protein D3C72_487300 [compost metagenome]